MFGLRIQIERNFGIQDLKMIKGFVSDIQNKSQKLDGTWFLAYIDGKAVGEVGLILFDYENLKIGRLQDVDIAPAYQGMGLGNQLLQCIIKVAKGLDADGLALFARQDGWVKDWYQRFGFIKVGESSK